MEAQPADKGQGFEEEERLFEEISIEQVCGEARLQMQAFLVGFRELLRKRHDMFQGYTQSELEKLIGGVSVIDLYVLIFFLWLIGSRGCSIFPSFFLQGRMF